MFSFSKKKSSSTFSLEAFKLQLKDNPVEIDLSGLNLNDNKAKRIFRFIIESGESQQNNIWSLNLSSNRLSIEIIPHLVHLVSQLFNLTELDLSNNRLKGPKPIQALHPTIIQHPSLRVFRIGNNELGPLGVAELAILFRASRSLALVDLGWQCYLKTKAGDIISRNPATGESTPQGKADMAPEQL